MLLLCGREIQQGFIFNLLMQFLKYKNIIGRHLSIIYKYAYNTLNSNALYELLDFHKTDIYIILQ